VRPRSCTDLEEGTSAEALVYDAAARMFWRNLRARASAAPVRALGANPAAYDLPPAADPGPLAAHLPEARAGQTYPAVHGMTYGVTHVLAPPVRPGQTGLLMSRILALRWPHAQGLTRRKRPRDAKLDMRAAPGAPQAGGGTAAQLHPAQHPKPGDPASGAGLPPVAAPPARRAPARGRAAAGVSRPASIHVDDFQRALGGGPSPAGGYHPKPNGGGGNGGGGGGQAPALPTPAAPAQLHRQVIAAAAAQQRGGAAGSSSLAQLIADPAVRAVSACACAERWPLCGVAGAACAAGAPYNTSCRMKCW